MNPFSLVSLPSISSVHIQNFCTLPPPTEEFSFPFLPDCRIVLLNVSINDAHTCFFVYILKNRDRGVGIALKYRWAKVCTLQTVYTAGSYRFKLLSSRERERERERIPGNNASASIDPDPPLYYHLRPIPLPLSLFLSIWLSHPPQAEQYSVLLPVR